MKTMTRGKALLSKKLVIVICDFFVGLIVGALVTVLVIELGHPRWSGLGAAAALSYFAWLSPTFKIRLPPKR